MGMIHGTPQAALAVLLAIIGGAHGVVWAAGAPVPGRNLSRYDAELDTLHDRRRQLALTTFERLYRKFDGWQNVRELTAAADRVLESELARSGDPAHQVAVLERHFGRVYMLWFREKVAFDSGRIPVSDFESRLSYPLKDTLFRLHDARQRLPKK